MKTLPLASLLAASLCVLACSPQASTTVQAGTDAPASTAFQTAHAEWVRKRAEDLARPDGWTSLTGLHWLDAGKQRVGAGEDNSIRLAIGPDQLGQVELRADGVYFQPAAGVPITVDETLLQGTTRLVPEGSGAGTTLAYDDGKGKISVIRRGQRLALRVRHADAPARRDFAGLDFFPADEHWRVQAQFVPHPAGRTLPIVNVLGEITDTPNPGYVRFKKEGHEWQLQALGDPAKGLNLMFQDQTTGRQTYGVGRYLRTDPVAADGSVTLDFNRAYNPPCAYTEFATCPLPPPENRLAQQDGSQPRVRLAVLAGEKKYATSHR
ncbi:hypothetical protein C1924_07635 [Stenotrophomonas sp. ESTM1D_MKCIP4_1]|uniref:DUF1684 domain-containing protein n=1 Tax=Stenotrophomonas sp. ESTM1D_MKCIP4_1 TaxID=2072414 RepID=UPI000D53E2CF|nr:DUF1684 domain-containing protein [Stenotrophomonas sp. ESTM1D_MKCIP4_1]AWH53056.1 hypothetical protein C1924_07635 [Stenotrophomonas sp. ESTM1D_MKCIP4_1]